MLKLSLFEGEQKCTDFVSVPLNANELLLPAGFNPFTVYGFNRLCPFTSHRHALKISKTFSLLQFAMFILESRY